VKENLRVAIIGQGYVGLPLSQALVQAGCHVVGVDVNQSKVDWLSAGRSFVEDITDQELQVMFSTGRYTVSSEFSAIKYCEIIIICVPTPLLPDNQPDLSFLNCAINEIAEVAPSGALIIKESTSYPGTTRNVIEATFKKTRPNDSFEFACAPERVDPGNTTWNHRNTPRVVGALTAEGLLRAAALYEQICDQVIRVTSAEVAEMAKLVENSFRLVNIALVTEVSHICNAINLNVHEVLNSAATKPYGFMKFTPSVGVGGHCIPIDPLYLSWFADQIGQESRLIQVAQKINELQPLYVVNRAQEIINKHPAKILVVGLGYKKHTSDLRESASVKVYYELKRLGHQVFWYDPLVECFDNRHSSHEIQDIDLVVYSHEVKESEKLMKILSLTKILDCTGSLSHLPSTYQL
jgi:UDP-N-acetyl-D-glucosamine dehydrogenase